MLTWVAFGFLTSLSLLIASFGITFSVLGSDKSKKTKTRSRPSRKEGGPLLSESQTQNNLTRISPISFTDD